MKYGPDLLEIPRDLIIITLGSVPLIRTTAQRSEDVSCNLMGHNMAQFQQLFQKNHLW